MKIHITMELHSFAPTERTGFTEPCSWERHMVSPRSWRYIRSACFCMADQAVELSTRTDLNRLSIDSLHLHLRDQIQFLSAIFCHEFSREEFLSTFPCTPLQDEFVRGIYHESHSSSNLENSHDHSPNAIGS